MASVITPCDGRLRVKRLKKKYLLRMIGESQKCYYNLFMHIEFDANKNVTNIRDRGLSFKQSVNFDFETAVFKQNTRRDYGEIRLRALGYLDDRIHALVFTETDVGIRIISFRKANKHGVLIYEQETKS
jgi:hypothetical protein